MYHIPYLKKKYHCFFSNLTALSLLFTYFARFSRIWASDDGNSIFFLSLKKIKSESVSLNLCQYSSSTDIKHTRDWSQPSKKLLFYSGSSKFIHTAILVQKQTYLFIDMYMVFKAHCLFVNFYLCPSCGGVKRIGVKLIYCLVWHIA